MLAISDYKMAWTERGSNNSLVFFGLYRSESGAEKCQSRPTFLISKGGVTVIVNPAFSAWVTHFPLGAKALTRLPKHQLYNSCSNTLCLRIHVVLGRNRFNVVDIVEVFWFHM